MFKTLLLKEFREQMRTGRLIVLVAVLVISGLISPLLAYYTPALLSLVPDMPIDFAKLIPTPTVADAIAQYVKNVSQFGVLLIVILAMGSVAQELERGTAGMLLVRPVRRSAVILAKWVVWVAVLAGGLLFSALLCLLYTTILFQMVPLGAFALLNLFMLIFLVVYLSVSLMASALVRTQAAAAGAAFGALAVLLILSSLPRISQFMPSQLTLWGSSLAAGGNMPAWPALAISLGIIAAALVIGCLKLEREEI